MLIAICAMFVIGFLALQQIQQNSVHQPQAIAIPVRENDRRY